MAIVAATVIAGPGCGINGFEIGRRTPNLGADNVFARVSMSALLQFPLCLYGNLDVLSSFGIMARSLSV